MLGRRLGRIVAVALFATGLFAAASAEAPLALSAGRAARARIVDLARRYLGTPYLYGGSTEAGMDCSGLVQRVYRDAYGAVLVSSLPRTAREQFDFVESMDRSKLQPGDLVFFNTTGPLAHVGIYEGEGGFIHAASEGRRTGVTESSLSEPYWSEHYAGAGRLIPPAEYLGIILTASLGGAAGPSPLFRGLEASVEASYRLGAFEAGLELRPSWDAGFGILRLPLVLTLNIDRRLRLFAGPALTLGQPSLATDKGSRSYAAEGGYLATIGLVWTPTSFRVGGDSLAPYLDLVYDRLVPTDGLGGGGTAAFHAGAGISIRRAF
jgi:probable lipoprotein NlpC